jgi:hypothetical protein
MAGGDPNRKFSVTFHMETDANDNPKMVFPQAVLGRQRVFRRLPDLSSRDIEGFKRIATDGKEGKGVIFKLKETSAKRWQAVTSANINRWVVSQVNGRVVDAFVVDQPIGDGLVVVWKGLTEEDLVLLKKEFTEIGDEKPKEKP